MNKKFKVGDVIIVTKSSVFSSCKKRYKEKGLKVVIGKIVNVNYAISIHGSTSYDIKVMKCSNQKKCKIFKEYDYCIWCKEKEIKLYTEYIKLKKFVQHGV